MLKPFAINVLFIFLVYNSGFSQPHLRLNSYFICENKISQYYRKMNLQHNTNMAFSIVIDIQAVN